MSSSQQTKTMLDKLVAKSTGDDKPVEVKVSKEDFYNHDSDESFGSLDYITNKSDEEWDYAPNAALDIPEEIQEFLGGNGLVWRWVRYRISGAYDAKAVNKAKDKGYEFLLRKSIPAKYRNKYDISDIDSMSDYITTGDLVLMVTTIARREKVQTRLNQMAEQQLLIANDLLKQNVREDKGRLNLISEHSTKVTGGGTREVDFSKRTKVTEDASTTAKADK